MPFVETVSLKPSPRCNESRLGKDVGKDSSLGRRDKYGNDRNSIEKSWRDLNLPTSSHR